MTATMARRPADAPLPGAAWVCRCGYTLGVITPRGLVIFAPRPVLTAAGLVVRCPQCRHRAAFERARLAA